MLKIKDNVDLKELEKFGFEYNEKERQYFKSHEHWYQGNILVYINSKTISCYTEDDSDIILDTIYDLIKADLVEKSDGNE